MYQSNAAYQATSTICADDKVDTGDRDLKASFAICSIAERKLFAQSSCIVPISMMVNKELEEREDRRFKATIQLVSTSFKSCVLLLGDTLYRHAPAIDSEEDDTILYERAKKAGDLWIERNEGVYHNSTMHFIFKRWDDYLNHPNFSEHYVRLRKLYEEDQNYQHAVQLNAKEYLDRQINLKKTNADYDKAFSKSIVYLIEECAAMCLWAEEGYSFEVYANGRCPAMAATYEKVIKVDYPGLLKSVGLRFKKRIHQKRVNPVLESV
jgi:hypothetical protein